MPMNVPVAKAEVQNDGLDFVSVLRDCLSCAVISLDERRRVTAFNPRAEELAGLKSAAVLGRGPEILPPMLQQIIGEIFSTGQAVNERRVIFPDQKRGDLAVQISATPTRPEGGAVSGAVLVLNDISSVRKWESNMRRLDRLHSIGTLSASMAHEVKNAFVAVRTFVDLLLEKNQEADLAQIVRLEMGRIDAIVGQMLRFSGPARPALSSLHVHFVLNKSLLLVQHLLDDKKIKITRSYNATGDLVEGDQDQFEQALLNLFLNAHDAMGENGRLEISTELLAANTKVEGVTLAPDKQFLRLTIRDNGTGIPPEIMERLFEPFFTTKPEGTGLGLAITRRIVSEHHGYISVQSELKKGTAFNLFLPAGKPAA
jgi:two-component system sensor histidine kinase HydH